MNAAELIEIFHDTQRRIAEDPTLQRQTLHAQESSRLYPEDHTSSLRKIKGTLKVDVVGTTTFQCARDSVSPGQRIAVLNFANPFEPGGGILRGAKAQEECLCRCSNLYNTLNQPRFLEEYYGCHFRNYDEFSSDRLIYSPDVTVLKSDDMPPQILAEPFLVDVITCAAPYLDRASAYPEQELMPVYRSRIKNILEAAMEQDVDILILGAFGCGAFHNDPALMSGAFYDLLIREQYARHFSKVLFAVPRHGRSSPNFDAFQKTFGGPAAKLRK